MDFACSRHDLHVTKTDHGGDLSVSSRVCVVPARDLDFHIDWGHDIHPVVLAIGINIC